MKLPSDVMKQYESCASVNPWRLLEIVILDCAEVCGKYGDKVLDDSGVSDACKLAILDRYGINEAEESA